MTGRLPTKDFPPGWKHVRVPMSSRRDALAALSLYTASRTRGVLAQQVARGAVRLLGPKVLPGPVHPWRPPASDATWQALTNAWRTELGPWEGLVPYDRRQERGGAIVLLLGARDPLAFIKAVPGDMPATEASALRAVEALGPTTFSAPLVLAEGTSGGWSWVALSPLPPRPHRIVRRPPLAAIVAEIQSALSDLPRPPGTPGHWVPAHGDFAPWNLRRIPRKGLWLLDWEDAGWAPPDADRVRYVAGAIGVGRPVPGEVIEPGEAARYWHRIVADRIDEFVTQTGDRPPGGYSSFERRILAALDVGRDPTA